MLYLPMHQARGKVAVQACQSLAQKFKSLRWDNYAQKYLPIERNPEPGPHVVPNAIFSTVLPTQIENPVLVAVSPDALRLLGLDIEQTSNSEETPTEEDLAAVFSGNVLLENSNPVAHCYCGHQFGLFSGQLGDGAAILLGEVKDCSKRACGEDEGPSLWWSLQLKGSGLTPYSREADGRKVLRSSIREFLCSEHMDALGVPTTRAGCIVTSDSRVVRDPLYSGQALLERCSVVLRIARTFFRFGSFELTRDLDPVTGRRGPSAGHPELLTSLANFVIFTLYPHLVTGLDDAAYLPLRDNDQQQRIEQLPQETYRTWFKEVAERTARLVAKWQCVGWVHGVLNTDNMSIIGDTLDYGPFGFIERFDPHYIPNLSDKMPQVCRWNCEVLAESLQPLLGYSAAEADAILTTTFDPVFEKEYLFGMRTKLGLGPEVPEEDDRNLISSLLDTMRASAADFTTTFLILGDAATKDTTPTLDIERTLVELLQTLGGLTDLSRAASFPGISGDKLTSMVRGLNNAPSVILQALGVPPPSFKVMQDIVCFKEKIQPVLKGDISKADHDRQLWEQWLHAFSQRLAQRDPGVLSSRIAAVQQANPVYILRNASVDKAIALAEDGDFSEVRRLISVVRQPFSRCLNIEDTLPPAAGARVVKVS